MNYFFLQFRIKTNYLFFDFFTNHGGITVELMTITKTTLGMTVQHKRGVNVRHRHISVASKALVFEYFSVKLYQKLFKTNKLNLSRIGWYKFLSIK